MKSVIKPRNRESGGDLRRWESSSARLAETIGFFYVADHGIPASIFEGVCSRPGRSAISICRKSKRLTHRMDERFRRGLCPRGQPEPAMRPIQESYEIGIDRAAHRS